MYSPNFAKYGILVAIALTAAWMVYENNKTDVKLPLGILLASFLLVLLALGAKDAMANGHRAGRQSVEFFRTMTNQNGDVFDVHIKRSVQTEEITMTRKGRGAGEGGGRAMSDVTAWQCSRQPRDASYENQPGISVLPHGEGDGCMNSMDVDASYPPSAAPGAGDQQRYSGENAGLEKMRQLPIRMLPLDDLKITSTLSTRITLQINDVTGGGISNQNNQETVAKNDLPTAGYDDVFVKKSLTQGQQSYGMSQQDVGFSSGGLSHRDGGFASAGQGPPPYGMSHRDDDFPLGGQGPPPPYGMSQRDGGFSFGGQGPPPYGMSPPDGGFSSVSQYSRQPREASYENQPGISVRSHREGDGCLSAVNVDISYQAYGMSHKNEDFTSGERMQNLGQTSEVQDNQLQDNRLQDNQPRGSCNPMTLSSSGFCTMLFIVVLLVCIWLFPKKLRKPLFLFLKQVLSFKLKGSHVHMDQVLEELPIDLVTGVFKWIDGIDNYKGVVGFACGAIFYTILLIAVYYFKQKRLKEPRRNMELVCLEDGSFVQTLPVRTC